MFLILGSCQDHKAISIGFISGLSGGNADLGEAGRNGAILAVEEINANGGVNGKPINLIIKNDGNDPDIAKKSAHELVDEKVVAIVGPFSTAMVEAVVSVASPQKTLVITPTASAMKLAGKDDYIILMNSSTRVNARAYADFMVSRRGYDRIKIAADEQNFTFSKSWYDEFELRYEELGGEILSLQYFNSQLINNYYSLVTDLVDNDPDCLLFIANSVDCARIAQQVRKYDDTIPIIAAEWAGTEQLIELGGSGVEGMEILQNINFFNQGAEFVMFLNNYEQRFNQKASFSGVMAYETVYVIADALLHQKKGENLKDTIVGGGPYEGLQQSIEFDVNGDMRRHPVFVQIKDKEYILAP